MVVMLQFSAAGLLQIEQLHVAAIGFEINRLGPQSGRNADAAQAVEAVATAGEQAFGMPAARFAALQVQPTIPSKRTACERVAGAAIAELGLQQGTYAAGPFVGGGMGIAVM